MRKYGKTDVTKLTIDFRYFANVPEKENDKNLTVLVKHKRGFMQVNIHDQQDATVTILLMFESDQHVSGNHLPIFRNVRLW